MNEFVEITRLTVHYVIHISAWFFFALAVSALVDLLYLDVVAKRTLRRRRGWVGVVMAAAVGAFSPFCSFVVVPLIRKLLAGGIPLSAVMAFWVASPAMDPEIYALTAAQIGVPLATARLLGAVVLSVGAGLIVLLMERRGMFTNVLRTSSDDRLKPVVRQQGQPLLVAAGGGQAIGSAAAGDAIGSAGTAAAASPSSGCVPAATSAVTGCGRPAAPDEDDEDDVAWWPTAKASLRSGRNWRITFRNMGRDTISLGKWLVLACVIEAVLVLHAPDDLIGGLLGKDPLVAIPLAALIGVPMYLNGVGAIPVVDGLLVKGMAPGAAVTFLLGGAVTTVPAMLAVRSIVRNNVFLLYLGVSVIGSIVVGFLAHLLL